MVNWLESRIVSDPKWPQCLITLVPPYFQPSSPREISDVDWEVQPLRGLSRAFLLNSGAQGLHEGSADRGLLPCGQAFAFPFISFEPKIAVSLIGWNIYYTYIYTYLCPKPCILGASCPEINIWHSGFSSCFYRTHSVLCALPSLCSHAFMWRMLRSMPKTCLHWFM